MFKRLTAYFGSILVATFAIPFLVSASFSFLPRLYMRSGAMGQADTLRFNEKKISVYLVEKDEVVQMPLDDYIIGVVTGEMPATYDQEALKAQAIVARSYALSKIVNHRTSADIKEHCGADVCTNFAHCQCYLSATDADKKWGADWSKRYYQKVKSAVDVTKGQYLTYGNEVAKTFFYANSSGKTENVKDVWGGDDLPYLKSVPSEGDKTAPDFESSLELTREEFFNRLQEKNPGVKKNAAAIGSLIRTEGGSVGIIELFGVPFKGTELRTIFGLRSANFEIGIDDKSVIFHVKGYGHGVGMSQYGANYLAKHGKKYNEILENYYPGTNLSTTDI